MLRINLLTQRRAKKADKAQRELVIGLGALVAAGALVFFLVHRPLGNEVDAQNAVNADLEQQNAEIKRQTKDLAKMQLAVKQAQEQEAAIERLNGARAVPAWMLWELSNILTPGRSPSLTTAMKRELQTNPNRRWQDGWDPKHVWITAFSEKNGRFKLEGGAQSDSDMTQLALRLQASMYFDAVVPEKGTTASDRNNVSYYKFSISGRVRY